VAASATPTIVTGSRPSQATADSLEFPLGLAIGPDQALYVSERQGHRVVRIDPGTGSMRAVAGTGAPGFSGDGGPATSAQLRCPDSIDFDDAGNLYIADRCNERLRVVEAATSVIGTVAGNGARGQSPDGPALELSLMGPFFLKTASRDILLFTDTDANLVRQVDLRSGRVSTLAGTGERGFSGDGGPALSARLTRPHIALQARNGDLIIGDSFNQRIRRVDRATGVIRTIAGNGTEGFVADGTPALEAPFKYFGAMIELDNGDLVFDEWRRQIAAAGSAGAADSGPRRHGRQCRGGCREIRATQDQVRIAGRDGARCAGTLLRG
jgi:hypothetical protein